MRRKKTRLPNNRILFRYIYKYKWHYLLGIISLLTVDIIQLQVPIITKTITDGLTQSSFTMRDVNYQVMMLLLIAVTITIGRYCWRYFIFGTGRKIEYHLRNDFFAHIEKLSLQYFNEHKTGDLMALATNDINAVRMLTGIGLLMGLDAIVLTILVIYKMISLSSLRLTLIAVSPLPIIAIGSIMIGKIISIKFKAKQEAFSKLTEHVQENISGIRVIKAFVQEEKEVNTFNAINKLNYERNMKLVKIFAWIDPLMGVITGLSITIILGYGGYSTITGQITIGDFVAFISYIGMLIWPMQAFGKCINLTSQGLASLQRIQAVLNQEPDIKDGDDLTTLDDIKGVIEIKSLTYSYPYAKVPVLKKINLYTKKGQTIGVVGRTGSGKTTLVNLFMRLYDTPEGTIFIDGIDITRLPLNKLRTSIGYVPQDNFLFSNTIEKNIAFGNPDLSLEEVIEAAKIANVHDNIMDFPNQYQTIVGERGVTLSGGQKQRVSIARALVMDTPILILDDSFSAVDTDTEEKILTHLKKTRKDKTTIIIAHRISTIQDSDIILVFDDGKIVERGNHERLMSFKGIYYDMVQRQQLEKELEEKE